MPEPIETPATPATSEEQPVPTKTFTLVGYTTSGNEDDGFKVTSADEMDTITIEEPITPFAINNALAEKGIWEAATLNCMLDALLQEDGCYLLEDENNGQPVGKLVPVEPAPVTPVWDHIIGDELTKCCNEKQPENKPEAIPESKKCRSIAIDLTEDQIESIIEALNYSNSWMLVPEYNSEDLIVRNKLAEILQHLDAGEKPLANNVCPKCGGDVTGESVEFISADRLTQDVTCNDCGYIFRHYYKLYDVEEI